MCFPQYEDSVDVVECAIAAHNLSTRVAGFVRVEDSGKMVTVKPERSTRRMSFGAVRVAGVSDEDEDEELSLIHI